MEQKVYSWDSEYDDNSLTYHIKKFIDDGYIIYKVIEEYRNNNGRLKEAVIIGIKPDENTDGKIVLNLS